MRQRYRWKMGSLQNLFKNRQLAGNVSNKYSRMLTFYRIPMAFFGEFLLLLEPLLLGYILYLSLKFHNPSLIVGAYVAITLYILWNVWPDEHASLSHKIRLTAFSPFMYFIFYIMSMVQVTAMIRCIINYRQVFRYKKVGSSWTSPERKGQQAQFS